MKNRQEQDEVDNQLAEMCAQSNYEKILEEIDRIDLCLLEGHWPSPQTLSTLKYILKQLTPPSWR